MVIPLIRPNQHFTSDERDALQVMIDKDLGTASIARIIGKHVSNIYLEPGRNAVQGSCLSAKAHTAASSRRKDSKPRPKGGNIALMQDIEKHFSLDHSPDTSGMKRSTSISTPASLKIPSFACTCAKGIESDGNGCRERISEASYPIVVSSMSVP